MFFFGVYIFQSGFMINSFHHILLSTLKPSITGYKNQTLFKREKILVNLTFVFSILQSQIMTNFLVK